MIRGVFDTEGIHYFIHNDHFGSMRVGPQIDLFNKKAIMVAAEDADRARAIIASLIEGHPPEEDVQERYSIGQKLRMVFEAVLFGWFVPGKKRRKGLSDG